ncbi:MAG: PD-(D/E)XK nuclease family protein [Thermus sp.]|uniref:PD-(D/E)XK nuclease family protein n=1 Tax=Thermus sp. TaxID=275 RepID=UPI003D0D93E8
MPKSLSVSELEDLVTCPFRFYVRHLLRPRRDREAEDGDRAGEVLRRLLGLLGAEAGPG